jgi:hypothetical protein
MSREWILKVIILMLLPALGWASDEFCSKEKGFNYHPNVQYQDSSFSNTCYITKEQFISKQALPGFILADLRSVKKQDFLLVSSAIPYSVVALKPLLANRSLDIVFLSDRTSLVSSMELCSDASLISQPYLIPYGVRGAQAYGLSVQSTNGSVDLFSVETYIKNQNSKLEDIVFVIPSNLAKSKIVEGLNTVIMESIDLDAIHERMAEEVLGQSIVVIPRLLFKTYKPDKNLLQLYPEIYHLDKNLSALVESLKSSKDTKKIIQRGC